VAPEKFVEAVKQKDANIVGISALMTTTMPAMRRTIEALMRDGLRDRVKVMVGGAPVSQVFCDDIGGDGYAKESTAAVVKAKALVRKVDTPETALNEKLTTDN
jgi:5-methyltetrahydrofolate--homocysteine methyltransferase